MHSFDVERDFSLTEAYKIQQIFDRRDQETFIWDVGKKKSVKQVFIGKHGTYYLTINKVYDSKFEGFATRPPGVRDARIGFWRQF